MKISRRRLIQSLPLLTALPASASVPSVTDRYFVFAYFGGGWDNLITFDPRDPDDFTQERVSETGIELGYEDLEVDDPLVETDIGTFGAYFGDLALHTDKLAVLRGMAMGSIAHNTARRHALTGFLPAGTSVRRSSLSTVLAAHLGSANPVPNLSIGVDCFNIDQPMWANALQAGDLDSLYSALAQGESDLSLSKRDAIETFFAKQAVRATTVKEQEIYANRLLSRELINQDLAQFFTLQSVETQTQIRKEHYGLVEERYGKSGEMAFIAAQALTNGISRCVTLDMTQSLDAHQRDRWIDDHGPDIQQGLNAVARLMEDLANTPYDATTSWLDRTTILCFSEFGRGALRNLNGGRDHSLINSMLLMGGGIRGGQIIGASSDIGMQAQAVDLHSGQLSADGEILTNNHVARTLLHSIGLEDDVGDYRAEPISALLS
ncbi:MAG: DUF1501 domain-containing protein [Myxococcota bacterium]|nr:DUF1501 domain-containing protein [Myxococcota bacterium]